MSDYEATAWIHLIQRSKSDHILVAALRDFARRGDSVQRGALFCGLLCGRGGFDILHRV